MRSFWLCILLVSVSAAWAEETRLGTVRVGDTVYRDVRVAGTSPRWVVLVHSEGVTQVPLSALPPELRERFGYDPESERAFDEELRRERERRQAERRLQQERQLRASATRAVRPPVTEVEVRPEVDLRPRFRELSLHTRDQGRRPSCAIFAIVGVLEFHYSIATGSPLALSEEYLLWATRQINPSETDPDGYSFGDVLQAIRGFGIARSELMPNTFGVPISRIRPGDAARADAATRGDVVATAVFGSNVARIEAVIRELNDGYPVAVALRWPHQRTLMRNHTLRSQVPLPEGGHAVAIVGYQQSGEELEDLLFIFRNSYGPRWGMAGYGLIAYPYLEQHIGDVLLFRTRDSHPDASGLPAKAGARGEE